MTDGSLSSVDIQNLEWRILYVCQMGDDWDVKELYCLAKSPALRKEVKRIYSSVRVCDDGTHYLINHECEKPQSFSSLNPPHLALTVSRSANDS